MSRDDELKFGAAVSAGGGVLFSWAAAPGLTWLDGGELAAAAWELGVPHPPGFPVFAQVHALVMRLMPLGDVAFRGNLASALWAAATLAVVYGAARALGAGRMAAAGGVLLLALAPLFGLHAATVEVYSGAAAITAGLVWGALASREDARWGLAVALLVGLGAVGHHAELRLFAPLAVVAVVAAFHSNAAVSTGRAVAVSGALTVGGAAVLLYLPLRAAARPWRNWGDPSSAGALWDHVMGTRIRVAYADAFGSFSWDALSTLAGQLVAYAPALLLVGGLGCALVCRRAWIVAAIWLVDCAYATTLNPMGLRDVQNGVPGLVALAIGAAAAFDLLGRRAWMGVGVVAAFTVVWVDAPGGLRADRGLARLMDAAADDAAPESLALVASDSFAAGLAFAQVVEGARPDLAVVVRQHAWDASSVGPVRRRLPAAVEGWRPGARVADLAHVRDGWPVVWEWAGGAVGEGAPPALGPRFPWFAPGAPDDGVFERSLRAEPATTATTRRELGRLATDLGLQRLAVGRPGIAVEAMELAATIDPLTPARWTNLGAASAAASDLAARSGQPTAATALLRTAAEHTRRALALEPDDRTARVNLARYLVNLRDADAALSEVDRLLGRDPLDADALGLRGVLRGNEGDLKAACVDFETALRRDPDQPEAKVGRTRACQL